MFVGYLTAPDENVLIKAKETAVKLFPNDIVAQRNYWLDKGAETMTCGTIEIIHEKDASFDIPEPSKPKPQS